MGSRVLGESILIDRYPFDAVDPIWPVTVDELKRHTQIDHAEDDLLLMYGNGGYLAAATEYIEARGQVSLIHQRRKLRLDELPAGDSVHIIRGPLVSVQSITYIDANNASQTLDAAKYRAITGGRSSSIYFDEATDVTLASGPGVVEINVTCGFASQPDGVPALWRQLVAEVAAYFYERRNAIAGGGLDPAFESVIDRKVTIAGGVKRYV